MTAAEKAIKDLSIKYEKIFIKKTYYGGGLGNLYGNSSFILEKLKNFYNNGKILIEPFLNIEKTYGSLCEIREEKIHFLGIDIQISENGKWKGFDFPAKSKKDITFIKNKSLILANFLKRKGIYGIANFDWLKEKKTGKIYALECNLRNNGFYFILDFARRYFNDLKELNIIYREQLKSKHKNFFYLKKNLKEKLEKEGVNLIENPGEKEGFIIISYQNNGEFSISFFYRNTKKILKIKKLMENLHI